MPDRRRMSFAIVATTVARGKTTTESGKLVLVWKKLADGSWKIAANTNADDQ